MKLKVLISVWVVVFPFTSQAEERPIRKVDREPEEATVERGEGKRERGRGERERRGGMFQRIDKNGDGLVSREEFFSSPRMEKLPAEKREMLFARFDLNDDGEITPDEIRQMQHNAKDRQRREFRSLDVDQSGGLSFEEFSQGKYFSKLPEEKRRQIFQRMDTNGDGQITPDDQPHHRRPHDRERPERQKAQGADPTE